MDGSTFKLALGTDGIGQRRIRWEFHKLCVDNVWQEASIGYWKAAMWRDCTMFEL